MAVYKRRLCTACKKEFQDATITKKGNKEMPPPCSCGAEARYMKKWTAEVKVPDKTGTLKKRKESFPTKDEARQWETEMLSKRDKGEVFSKKQDTTFLGAAQVFLAWCDEREAEGKLADGSAKSYRERTNNHLIPYFAGRDIRHIEWEDVNEYRKHRRTQVIEKGRGKGQTPSDATINREVAALKRLLAIAVQKRIIPHHNMTDYEMLNEDNERERFLTHEEIDNLIEECAKTRPSKCYPGKEIPLYPDYLRVVLIVALNTGLRIGGVLTLKWEEIDWKRNEIVKIVKHHRSKKKEPVHIPMTTVLRDELLAWRARDGVTKLTGWVFPSPKKPGIHVQTTSNFGLPRALRGAKIEDYTFHDNRHTFCTLFLEEYPDKIEVLRKIVGHSSSYITRRYAHITERATHAAMANFSIGNRGENGGHGGRMGAVES